MNKVLLKNRNTETLMVGRSVTKRGWPRLLKSHAVRLVPRITKPEVLTSSKKYLKKKLKTRDFLLSHPEIDRLLGSPKKLKIKTGNVMNVIRGEGTGMDPDPYDLSRESKILTFGHVPTSKKTRFSINFSSYFSRQSHSGNVGGGNIYYWPNSTIKKGPFMRPLTLGGLKPRLPRRLTPRKYKIILTKLRKRFNRAYRTLRVRFLKKPNRTRVHRFLEYKRLKRLKLGKILKLGKGLKSKKMPKSRHGSRRKGRVKKIKYTEPTKIILRKRKKIRSLVRHNNCSGLWLRRTARQYPNHIPWKTQHSVWANAVQNVFGTHDNVAKKWNRLNTNLQHSFHHINNKKAANEAKFLLMRDDIDNGLKDREYEDPQLLPINFKKSNRLAYRFNARRHHVKTPKMEKKLKNLRWLLRSKK